MEPKHISQRDQNFLDTLQLFINEELSYIGNNDQSKEKYLIFQQAFNQILDYVQAYKVLLGSIKKEYELCIDALEKGNIEAINLKSDLSKSIGHSSTLFNLKRRNDELKFRVSDLTESNNKLEESLKKLFIDNEKYRPKKKLFDGKFSFLNDSNKSKNEENSIIEELIPGLSIEEATDIEKLNDILQKVEYRLRDMTAAQNTKFSSKSRKIDLLNILSEKVTTRDSMQIKTDSLKHKLHLYKLAVSAAKEYYGGNSQYNSIQEALTRSIINGSLVKHVKTEEENDQIDDTSLESEAEYILDYIDKFNELFEHGKYKEAAFFAAASPRNVLRTIETLYRFKSVSNIKLFENDPLLLYCNAILDSTNESVPKPSAAMSLEFIKIALDHEKIDVLIRWISQRKLTFSYENAKIIEDFVETHSKYTRKGLELSLFIYKEIGSLLDAIVCMIKLGRIKIALQYVKTNSEKLKPDNEFYLKLLNRCPELEFANALAEESIPVEQIVSTLLDSEQPYNGLKFIKYQIDNISKDFLENLDEKRKEELTSKKQKLKTSYDTLCKFSFLTQNEDQFTKSIASETRDQVQLLYSRLGKERPSNSLHEFSLSTKSDDKNIEKTVRFDKIETRSFNNLTHSESVSYFEQAHSISGDTANSTDYVEESNKTKLIPPLVPLHKDFYNKFNQEIFDDEDLN